MLATQNHWGSIISFLSTSTFIINVLNQLVPFDEGLLSHVFSNIIVEHYQPWPTIVNHHCSDRYCMVKTSTNHYQQSHHSQSLPTPVNHYHSLPTTTNQYQPSSTTTNCTLSLLISVAMASTAFWVTGCAVGRSCWRAKKCGDPRNPRSWWSLAETDSILWWLIILRRRAGS